MSAPLVVNTKNGICWTRRTVTSSGIALYAPETVRTCPRFVMATLTELAEQGIVGSTDVLPMPVGTGSKPRTMLDRARDALNARMTKDDLRLVLENTITHAEALKARVAELEAERHSTNEALDDAVQELRTPYAERARRERDPGRRRAWLMLAQVDEAERVAEALLTPEAARSADRLTALLAPVQVLREDGACSECGDAPSAWCPGCAKCSCVSEHDAGCTGVMVGDR